MLYCTAMHDSIVVLCWGCLLRTCLQCWLSS